MDIFFNYKICLFNIYFETIWGPWLSQEVDMRLHGSRNNTRCFIREHRVQDKRINSKIKEVKNMYLIHILPIHNMCLQITFFYREPNSSPYIFNSTPFSQKQGPFSWMRDRGLPHHVTPLEF